MKGKLKLALFSFVIIALLLGASPALAVPVLPHAFYGTVKINGADAPVGTVVSAKAGRLDCGSYTIKVAGRYGNRDQRDYLTVQGDISNGATLTFYVRGILTDTGTFSAGGGPSEKNLALEITPQSITGKVEETVPLGQTNYVIDASVEAQTTVTVSTTAEVTITVEKYASNPHRDVPLPASMLPRYIDIKIDNPDAILWPMHVEQTYTDAEVAGLVESSLGMYYFKTADNAWHRCSDTGVNTTANYIWANMTRDEASGSPLALGGRAIAPSGGGGGGAPPALPPGTTDVSPFVTAYGVFTRSVIAESADFICRLTIEVGTKGLTKDKDPLREITMVGVGKPPAPPGDACIIGSAYDLGPDGATFSPPIALTIKYDPKSLPAGVAEQALYLAYWDGLKWVALETTVNAEANTASGKLSHFTIFAVIAPIPPAPAPAAFSISNLSIQPTEAQPKQAVTITVSVTNTGGMEGSYTVVLKINGVKEAEKSVTIAAGKSQNVSFSLSKEQAASYSVAVDGLSGSFTVAAPAPPPQPPVPTPPPPAKPPINWPVLGGIMGGVIVVALLVFLVTRRRAY